MFKYLLYQIEYRYWLFLALALAVIVHLSPNLQGLPSEGKSVLGIVVMTVLLVIFEPVPLPIISLLIVVLEVIFRISTPDQVAQSFLSDSVIFIAGSMMLALAVAKQHLDKRILLMILRLTGTNIYWTVFCIVGLSSLMASIMGETSVAAVMLPVALILVRNMTEEQDEASPVRAVFLMAIAYGCAVAAIGTPSGGARNAIMISYWDRLSGLRMGYLEWMLFMYPLVLVESPLVYFMLRIVYKPKGGTLIRAYRSLHRDVVRQKKLRVEDWITIDIVILTVLLWIFFSKDLGLGTIALIGALLCIVTGILKWEDINHNLNWGVILLYSSVISIGLWMDTTGAANWIAGGMQYLLQSFQIHGGLPLILVVSMTSMLMGAIMGSGPAIAILGPIILRQAQLMDASPMLLGMIVVASSSYANFSPMSSPACTIVYGSGLVRRQEYFRMGLPVALVSLIIISLFAEFYWSWLARLLGGV